MAVSFMRATSRIVGVSTATVARIRDEHSVVACPLTFELSLLSPTTD
jgi:hypothetical protein